MAQNIFEHVLLVGPDGKKGGIANVINTYKNNYTGVSFIASYPDRAQNSKMKQFIKCIWEMHRMLLKNNKIKIVHFHVASNGSFIRKVILMGLAKIHGTAVVFHIHGGRFKEFYKESFLKMKFIKWILHKCDAVICLSEEWKAFFENKIALKNIHIIGNPVESWKTIPQQSKNNNIQLLFLGKICEAKGIFTLIETLKRNKYYKADWLSLQIAGFGDKEQLERLKSIVQKSKNIEFLGWIDGREKIEAICNSDINILPSRFEGLPVSIIESMYCGKPIIATNVGGVGTLVEQHVNGWLYDVENNEILEDILCEVVEKRAMLQQYGEMSKLKAQRFNPEIIGKELKTLYKKLLQK